MVLSIVHQPMMRFSLISLIAVATLASIFLAFNIYAYYNEAEGDAGVRIFNPATQTLIYCSTLLGTVVLGTIGVYRYINGAAALPPYVTET